MRVAAFGTRIMALVSGGGADIFPLPLLPLPTATHTRSRRQSQRIVRSGRITTAVNECVWSLNYLYGSTRPVASYPSAARDSCMNRIVEAVESCKPPPSVEEPEAAFQVLLGSKAIPYGGDEPSGVASFELESLSLPSSAGGCCLLDVLEGEDRIDLQGFESKLLLSDCDFKQVCDRDGRANTYTDPKLKDDYSLYVQFINELKDRKMLRFGGSCKERVGVFCVAKKSGKQILIVDCRRINQRLRRPPRTRLCSSSGFCEIEVPEGNGLYYSSHDVSDCFYQL